MMTLTDFGALTDKITSYNAKKKRKKQNRIIQKAWTSVSNKSQLFNANSFIFDKFRVWIDHIV